MIAVDDASADVLRSPRAGALVIRGSAVRSAGYAVGLVLAAATSVFLLRGLGVVDFGRYATVAALLGVVSTLSDAGLTAVGVRELAVRAPGREREDLLRNLVALRLALTLLGIVLATGFALAAGYDRVMVAGVLLGGLGVLLVNSQATMMGLLSVDLRLGRITFVEVLRSAVTLAAVAGLALAGASLLPFFAVQILVGVVVLAVTPRLVSTSRGLLPRLGRTQAVALLREGLPVGIALAMNVLYLRLLVVMVSLAAARTETGLYGTAFRVVELLVVLPPLVLGAALPLLAASSAERETLSRRFDGLFQAGVVGSLGLALVVTVAARPALRLLGGEAYVGATDMLRIQVWALVPLAAGHALGLGLLTLRRQRDLAVANAAALVVVLAAGIPLVRAYGGEGAAVAGLLAELALLAALAAFLGRAARPMLPSARFLWRPLVALGAGAATLLVPLPAWLDAAVAGAVFLAVALAVSAVPPEILDALRSRRVPR